MNSASVDSSAPTQLDALGRTVPRLWTPPLRALTPATTTGYDEIAFARTVLGIELDPWEQWLSIHAGELLPDGRPRFRTLLALVARQNGKSTWARVKILYWMFVELVEQTADDPFIIATSTDRSYAKKFWTKTAELIKRNQWLSSELATIRLTISEECITTTSGVEYGFAANNGSAGRSRTVHRALIDEVREHKNLDAWHAISGAMNAVPYGQIIGISNQGDDTATLLDSLREPALMFIETGEGDPRLGLFEWSSPPGADPTDLDALAMANPNLGRRVDTDALLGSARRAVAAGGEELSGFRTEVMCQRVALLDPAIDPEMWHAAGAPAGPDLAEHRDKVALCLDVSMEGDHATLMAAATIDGVTWVDVVQAWSGPGCTKQLRADLPGVVAKVRPRTVGWFPNGPAAVLVADMAERPRSGWPPRRVTLQTLTTEQTAVCMALPALLHGGDVRHQHDPMVTAQVASAQRLRRGDGWVYTRRGAGPVDAVYAMAGAVHLARTLPPPRPRLAAL